MHWTKVALVLEGLREYASLRNKTSVLQGLKWSLKNALAVLSNDVRFTVPTKQSTVYLSSSSELSALLPRFRMSETWPPSPCWATAGSCIH